MFKWWKKFRSSDTREDIIYMDYITQLRAHNVKSVTKSQHDLFMEQYELDHKYCPDCGYDGYVTTLIAYIYNSNDHESYKDENTARCKCGSVHIVHDRVSESKLDNN
jgi:hypothetical protein